MFYVQFKTYIMASVTEAETGAVFKNCQVVVSLRENLNEMGHP